VTGNRHPGSAAPNDPLAGRLFSLLAGCSAFPVQETLINVS
jgi:hypothetical protein